MQYRGIRRHISDSDHRNRRERTDVTTIVAAHDMSPALHDLYAAHLGGAAETIFLAERPAAERAGILSRAEALVLWNPRVELSSEDRQYLNNLRFVQLMTAGFDHVPFALFPDGVTVAFNAGAYAEPMAEHALAMALAAAKRLPVEHAEMKAGRFNQFALNKRMAGGVCGIVGFGGIGKACARLFRCLGMEIHAINRSGRTDEPVDFIGAAADLDRVLAASDVLILSAPLTKATEGMIGARRLGLMREDAILVNVARGELVDQAALYEHLKRNTRFFAGLEAWWVEPVRHGEFRLEYPFLELPNVIAAPHNSPAVPGTHKDVVRLGCENLKRWATGEAPWNLVPLSDRYS